MLRYLREGYKGFFLQPRQNWLYNVRYLLSGAKRGRDVAFTQLWHDRGN